MEYQKLQQLKKDTVSEKEDVTLSLCPNGSQFSISINGTTLTATKTALKATIGGVSISINFQGHSKLLPPQNTPALTILVVSGDNPLHAVMGTPRYVTANITLVQGYFDPNAHHICLLTTGQGTHYLSANNNAFYVGIDSNNNIQVEAETEFDNADMYTFRQEHITNDHMRYYLETGGNKYYLMVGSDGNVTTLNANDLVLGSQNDTMSRFRTLYM